MKLFKPQVQLAKRQIDENNIEYFLHSVTLFDKTNFRNDGNAEIQMPNGTGVLDVELWTAQDGNLPDFKYITPVVHSFSLGVLPADYELKTVNVQMMVEEMDEDGNLSSGNRSATGENNKRPAGKTSTSTANIDEDARPMGGLF